MSTKPALTPASTVPNAICGCIPPRLLEVQGRHRLWRVLLVSMGICGLAIIYFFNPALHGFYPACIFYKTTGLLCPGCGTLRAMHQLLHGHLDAAFRFNALIVSSLPLVAFGSAQAMRYRAANKPALAWIRPRWLWFGLAILLLFGILRNIPGASNYYLAPL